MNALTFVGLLQAINRLPGIHGLACSLCRSDVACQQNRIREIRRVGQDQAAQHA
jgi:hypothetical protein